MNTPPLRSVWRPLLCAMLGSVALTACVAPPHRHEMRMAPPAAAPAAAPTVYFYPQRGQSPEQQDRDRFECYQWGRQQTGIDPGMTPIRGTPPQAVAVQPDGRGTAVGAITGGAIGAAVSSPHHAGEGLVIGAILGTVVGAASDNARAEAAERRYEARAAAAQARAQAPLVEFRRAMGACMSGRGYSIG